MPNWPQLIIALVLSAYWTRVRHLARKIRKTTGRSANFRPREPLGRLLRLAWVPIVMIWVAHPYASALLNPKLLPWLLTPLAGNPAAAWSAAALAAAALAGSLVCWKKMGASWRMGIDPHEKTRLIVTGPYAYLRHPIYALSSLLMLATMTAIPSPLMLPTGLLHLLLLQWEARREEKYLTLHHGPTYALYCRAVGRFLPRSFRPFPTTTPSPVNHLDNTRNEYPKTDSHKR